MLDWAICPPAPTMSPRSSIWALLAGVLLAPGLLVAGGRARQDDLVLDQMRSYFALCDHDGEGWISFREARDGLRLDRAGFAEFDADRDGRIDLDEFAARYSEFSALIGRLPRPRPAQTRPVDLPREPEQILAAYDDDRDGALSEAELQVLLDDYGRSEIPVALALEKLDQDGEEGLRAGELELLARMLATLHVAASGTGAATPTPTSILDLFGRAVERPHALDGPPLPPLIVGPVPVFRRLDLDDDGGIELDDLHRLLSPLQLSVSLSAIHATLDLDQDGRIDPDELDRALGARFP